MPRGRTRKRNSDGSTHHTNWWSDGKGSSGRESWNESSDGRVSGHHVTDQSAGKDSSSRHPGQSISDKVNDD